MRIGIAADHGGFALKAQLTEVLEAADYEVVDFGDPALNPRDDFPGIGPDLPEGLVQGP